MGLRKISTQHRKDFQASEPKKNEPSDQHNLYTLRGLNITLPLVFNFNFFQMGSLLSRRFTHYALSTR